LKTCSTGFLKNDSGLLACTGKPGSEYYPMIGNPAWSNALPLGGNWNKHCDIGSAGVGQDGKFCALCGPKLHKSCLDVLDCDIFDVDEKYNLRCATDCRTDINCGVDFLCASEGYGKCFLNACRDGYQVTATSYLCQKSSGNCHTDDNCLGGRGGCACNGIKPTTRRRTNVKPKAMVNVFHQRAPTAMKSSKTATCASQNALRHNIFYTVT